MSVAFRVVAYADWLAGDPWQYVRLLVCHCLLMVPPHLSWPCCWLVVLFVLLLLLPAVAVLQVSLQPPLLVRALQGLPLAYE